MLRNPWVFVPALVAAVAVLAVAVLLLVNDDGFVYDEDAHRDAVEEVYGEDHIRDWSKYRDAWLGVCESEDLALMAAVFIDRGTSRAEFGLNIDYTCPGRRGEIPPALRG